MAHPVLLVHSSGPQGPGEGSSAFADRLWEDLGPDQEFLFPLLPDPDEPHYEPWSRCLGEILAELDQPVIVGHSLGGSVTLKHLAEHGAEGIAGLVMVAVPFWGDSGWEAEWALPDGWPDPAARLPPIFLFHSRDDEEIPFSHLERYATRIPHAVARPLDGNGHLYERGELTEIVEAIRGLGSP